MVIVGEQKNWPVSPKDQKKKHEIEIQIGTKPTATAFTLNRFGDKSKNI